MTGQHLCECALARAVRAHDRVDLPGAYRKIDALEDRHAGHVGGEIPHFEEVRHPTLPSSLSPRSLVASTANSIGSCWKTSLQKPLMIIDTASSVPMPRWRK